MQITNETLYIVENATIVAGGNWLAENVSRKRKLENYEKNLVAKEGYKKEDVDNAVAYLTNPDNFPFLSVGIDGESRKPEKLNILKDGGKVNMSADRIGKIRMTKHWIKRFLDNESDMMLALQAQMAHEHCHHLYDNNHIFSWNVSHPRQSLLNNWINECRNDTLGCARAFDGDPERTHKALEFLKNHADKLGHEHTSGHPSWEFRQKIAERGVFDEESVRLITEEARKYVKEKALLPFKDFNPKIVKEVTHHAGKFYGEDLSFCLKKEGIEKGGEESVREAEPELTKEMQLELEKKQEMSIPKVKEIVKEKREEKKSARGGKTRENKAGRGM